MKDFIAIDVETANYEPSSICSIGCVKFVGGHAVDSFYSLVHPEPDWYVPRFTAIHGLSDEHTYQAPPFDTVWKCIEIWADGLPFVAHNASFDYKCVSSAARIYQLEPPSRFHCTLRASRRLYSRFECPSKSLPNLCSFLGIDFNNHHNALADAEAAGRVCLEICREFGDHAVFKNH